MAILPILTEPHPILRSKAKPVAQVDDNIRKLMDDMLETMYDDQGVGLAANQIGSLQKIIVMDLGESEDRPRPQGFYPLYMANPEIIARSEEKIMADEGCLSVPGQIVPVNRPATVTISYVDYHNQKQEMFVEGWLARVIQHEMDHLEGKLLIDYLSKLKKDMALKKLIKTKNMQKK
jgi:peptide deformylase